MKNDRYRIRVCNGADDIQTALELRAAGFRSTDTNPDMFDDQCLNLVVEDGAAPVCTFRIRMFDNGAQVGASYAAQSYDLTALKSYPEKMLEIGRFCTAADRNDPDILRTAWAGLAWYVDHHNVKFLFGCSSFPGTQPDNFLDSFSLLRSRHLAPAIWRPVPKSDAVMFDNICAATYDQTTAVRNLPPLLRTYLGMGGWVSDHVVIDRKLDTLHVFTGVEVDNIPKARAKALRLIAQRPTGT